MSDASFGLKIGLEGEREFKRSLTEINREFRVLGSEMKVVASQFGKNDRSASALSARNQVLAKSIERQKTKVETMRQALTNATESFGEAEARTKNWQIKLNNATAELNTMERELDENTQAIDEFNVDKYLTSNGVSAKQLQVQCNFTDMCDDADAILLSKMLQNNPPDNLHALSDAMNSHYSQIIVQNRYTAFEADGLDYSSQKALATSIWDKMNDSGTDFFRVGLLKLAGESTGEERMACCHALAGYLLARSS